jgi:hypothetical protein
VVAGDSKEIKGKEVIKMPFGNGTGPMGLGPMTRRGAGFCDGFGRPGFTSTMPRYLHPYGYSYLTPGRPRWGYGFGRGLGHGWRRWGSYKNPWW